jgi:opacity protein-like surface antigen
MFKYSFAGVLGALLVCGLPQAQAKEINKYYVEAFGGASKNLIGQPETATEKSGGNFNGVAKEMNLSSGRVAGLRLGYVPSNAWRFDLSYYDTSNDMVWKTYFPTSYGNYKGVVSSKSLLATAYYTFTPIGKLSPYVGAGVGVGQNTLKSVTESYSPTPYSYIDSGEVTGAKYRIATGVDYSITPKMKLNLDISALYLGEASSGSYRSINGSKSPIGKFEFKDIGLADITVGLRYSF